MEKKFVSHSSKANPREEKEEEGEENAANTTRKMLFATNEKAANDDNVVNAKSKDENTNESWCKNSGGGEMSLLERRVSDLERLLRASELGKLDVEESLHFSSQPTNKDSDEKEQNNNKSSGEEERLVLTLSQIQTPRRVTPKDDFRGCEQQLLRRFARPVQRKVG